MKVLVDIGHPAHVHYFRNVMIRMTQDGHTFKVIVRNKEVSQQLLQAYGISYTSRGKGATSRLGKFLYMVKADIQVFFIALRFRPDVFLSGASPYAAHVSWLLRKPHVALDDTEHAVFARKFYLPFTSKVITPFCYQLDLGNKQVRMNSFLELFYLHPKYRTESTTIRQKLGVTSNEPFALLRFVSWGASHDYGVKGIDLDVLPHEMHKVLAEADLYIGEGATMASECAMLGTPAIYINKLEVSYVTEESKHLSIVHTRNATELLDALNRMLADGNGKQHAREKLASYIQMLDDPNPILIEQLELVHKGKG